nr:immunoglobulin heavy chain junction region [Macaca mulatta]MOX14711.1 immunoglobulin heavy chain junction region [Macaca mulatta]MOX14739.1 immunoglobulin heavy chain junction region [Macaca mulatta]MOX14743.1 immunoglobulin heavy chain junction region [Macaca mulatta]MOX14756.1 immunoglobulin heavy chain junction region [Macaca mulatta]
CTRIRSGNPPSENWFDVW